MITYSECASVALVIQHVNHMRRIILSPVAYLDLQYPCTLSHNICAHYPINDPIFVKKVTECYKCGQSF